MSRIAAACTESKLLEDLARLLGLADWRSCA